MIFSRKTIATGLTIVLTAGWVLSAPRPTAFGGEPTSGWGHTMAKHPDQPPAGKTIRRGEVCIRAQADACDHGSHDTGFWDTCADFLVDQTTEYRRGNLRTSRWLLNKTYYRPFPFYKMANYGYFPTHWRRWPGDRLHGRKQSTRRTEPSHPIRQATYLPPLPSGEPPQSRE